MSQIAWAEREVLEAARVCRGSSKAPRVAWQCRSLLLLLESVGCSCVLPPRTKWVSSSCSSEPSSAAHQSSGLGAEAQVEGGGGGGHRAEDRGGAEDGQRVVIAHDLCVHKRAGQGRAQGAQGAGHAGVSASWALPRASPAAHSRPGTRLAARHTQPPPCLLCRLPRRELGHIEGALGKAGGADHVAEHRHLWSRPTSGSWEGRDRLSAGGCKHQAAHACGASRLHPAQDATEAPAAAACPVATARLTWMSSGWEADSSK